MWWNLTCEYMPGIASSKETLDAYVYFWFGGDLSRGTKNGTLAVPRMRTRLTSLLDYH